MKIPKAFLVTIMLISVLTLSIVLCACKNDNNEQSPSDDLRNADWIKIYICPNSNLKNPTYSTIINSLEDLLAMCDEDTSPVFNKEDEYSSNKYAIDKLKEYNDEFFRNKSLVIIFGEQSGGDYYVKDFEINNTSLNITLMHEVEAGAIYPDEAFPCVYFLEFDKKKIEGVIKIKVNHKLVVKK